MRDLDAIAVTIGPGLALCLRVGVLKARELARDFAVPLVPVHHMEAHALVARLGARPPAAQSQTRPQRQAEHLDVSGAGGAVSPRQEGPPEASGVHGGKLKGQGVAYPFLCLLVSGGHNLLLLCRGVGDYVQACPPAGFLLMRETGPQTLQCRFSRLAAHCTLIHECLAALPAGFILHDMGLHLALEAGAGGWRHCV